MAGEWPTARIEEVAERVAMGPFGSSIKVETFVPEGVPVISGQHLHGWRVDDSAGFNFITPEHAEKLRNANVRRGDVIFTHRGTIGQVSYIPSSSAYDRYVVSQSQFFLRPDLNKALPEYLVAYFRSPEGQHKLLANTSQVGVPSIAQPVTYLRSIEIPLPPLPEQRAIAHILGTLDDKIELNRRQNETLEAMARALFKAWFVDFEPVRAKMEGRWQRGQSLPGLPAHLYDLFPDRLVDSELGEIPEGWEVDQISNHFRVTMGQSPPGSTYNEKGDGLPFYQGRVDFGFRFPTRRVFCTAPTRLADAGDTLVTVRAPVGDSNMALERCCIGRGVAAVRHTSGAVSYTYYFVRSLKSVFESFEAEGTVFGAITKDAFLSIKCVVPPTELVQRFEQLCRPIDEKIERAERESRTLAALRDALLPKLISGELRVKDAEQFLKERV
jgi:type I restriction enzyme S subunit